MSKNTQTAIEWLAEQYEKSFTLKVNNVMTSIIEQAKEMEKQMVIDAWKMGRYENDKIVMSERFYSEQYYNETYGSKGSDDHIVDTNEMVSSQTEISDEEIERRIKEVGAMGEYYKMGYRDAIKWYREQLKIKGNGNK